MDFAYNEDQKSLRKSAREFLESEAPITLARRMLDDPTGFDEGLWKHMAELGWMGIAIPESDGGLGLGMLELCLLLEEMGRLVVPSPFFSTVALAAPIIAALTDGAERSELLGAIASGSRKLTVAISEENDTFAAPSFKTKAKNKDGTWLVNGTKLFVTDAQIVDAMLVVTGVAPDYSVFLVEASDAVVTPKNSLDPTRRLSSVTFKDSPAILLGEEGLATAALGQARNRSAVALAAEATGICDAVTTRAVEYARERQQFGRAIGSFQAISHKCADMLVAAESARSTTYFAAWSIDEGEPGTHLAAATAKASTTSGAVSVCENGIQVHGGIGFTWEHDMHLYYRRAKFTELFAGSGAQWRERIACLLAG
ncbi:MAG: acyl-CoA dehydrogenase family protein [Actinomycetota bacterium]